MEIPWTKELELTAIKWTRDKTKRCGRTAFQFSKELSRSVSVAEGGCLRENAI